MARAVQARLRPDFTALPAVYLLATVSGAIALVYEVLWMRRFASLFGATAPAASVTISAFFLGMALGSAVIGRLSPRFGRPLRAYGWLEILIGLSALLVEPIAGLYWRLYPALYSTLADQAALSLALKSAFAAAALLLPAFLMGGTLTLLAQTAVRSRGETGVIGSGLYAVNALGAAFGALSVPFYLLFAFGVEGSYLLAVAASLLLGAAALLLDRFRPAVRPPVEDAPRAAPAKRSVRKASQAMPWILSGGLPVLAFLSGALTLGLEVLWMRMLAQIHENSIYSFAAVLAIFLLSLAAGAGAAQRLLKQGRRAGKMLGYAWVVSGLLAFASPALFYRLSQGLSYATDLGPPALVTLGLAAASILLPTLAAGMILPLVLQLACQAREDLPGPLVGSVLAPNTAGAIVGPLLVTYLLLPSAGLWVGIAAMAAAMILLGEAALASLQARRSALRRLAIAGFFLCFSLAANPLALPRVRLGEGESLLDLREGAHGIVAVLENAQSRWMVLNNFYTLGGTASAIDERRQAQIPLFLHPAPRKVALLGLGTGITAGGALIPPVQSVVALEMVPEVVRAARGYFGDANLALLDDPRVNVVSEDARTYLPAAGQRFDVVIGDLVVPWRSGEASLFTLEHFQTVKESLAQGGLFCQWLPMFQLSSEQFKIIAATFLDVFPNTTLWRGDLLPNTPALALIGHLDPAALDPGSVDERIGLWSRSTDQPNPLISAPGGLWLFSVGPLRPSDAMFGEVRRNRLSRPWIEMLSPLPQWSDSAGGTVGWTGQALFEFMERTRQAPLEGSVLSQLDEAHQRWREAGAMLWQASMLLHQGHEEEANRRAAEGIAMLPPELRSVLGGE